MNELARRIENLKDDVADGKMSPNQVVDELEQIYKDLDEIDTHIYNLIHSDIDQDTEIALVDVRRRIGF